MRPHNPCLDALQSNAPSQPSHLQSICEPVTSPKHLQWYSLAKGSWRAPQERRDDSGQKKNFVFFHLKSKILNCSVSTAARGSASKLIAHAETGPSPTPHIGGATLQGASRARRLRTQIWLPRVDHHRPTRKNFVFSGGKLLARK